MKYATTIFTEVLSGLFQQGTISSDKRNAMVKCWIKSQKEGKKETLKELLDELYYSTTNTAWKINIQNALETL